MFRHTLWVGSRISNSRSRDAGSTVTGLSEDERRLMARMDEVSDSWDVAFADAERDVVRWGWAPWVPHGAGLHLPRFQRV